MICDPSMLHCYQCIYCLRTLPKQSFNREHVLSDAFGRYTNALVLHNCVCEECNSYFSRELEIVFTRESFETILRYKEGIKPVNPFGSEPRFVELSLPLGNPWGGVRLKLVATEGRPSVQIIPQVAIQDTQTGNWIHFTLEEISKGALLTKRDVKNAPMRIHAPSAHEGERVTAALAASGIPFKKLGDLGLPIDILRGNDVLVDFTYTINRTIRRCIAKYAFNYLAATTGGEFVLGRDFDVIRRFIRLSETPSFPLVIEEFRPILYDDSPTIRQTKGHLITVNWTGSGADLVAQVSIFNYLTYSVSLARQFEGLWRPVRKGSHFNIEKRLIEDLTGVSAHLI